MYVYMLSLEEVRLDAEAGSVLALTHHLKQVRHISISIYIYIYVYIDTYLFIIYVYVSIIYCMHIFK